VRPKKRDVFVVDAPATLPGCPLVIDPGGVWFRPEGSVARGHGRYLTGAPPRDGDPDEPPLDAIDHGLFDEVIWPVLAARVPAFEALRVRSAWAGYYDMNGHDHNGLAGRVPAWDNVYAACGFSGHGMQQAPAVGAALAALIAEGTTDAPGLDALSPQRLLDGRTLVEANVI
jgi:glycine/D-amino acid oxidase-like deaminating enzyme